MATITPEQVQKLREKSGAGIMDCKRALENANGDYEKAMQFLRERGKASANQKAGRRTGQGLVCSWVSSDGKKAGMVELNCESDFVARTSEFQDFAKKIVRFVAENPMLSVDSLKSQIFPETKETVETILKEKIGNLGENILIKKIAHSSGNGKILIGNYVHGALESSPECGALGVLLELESEKDVPEVRNLLKELCLQVAASSPKWIRKEDVPPEIVEKELSIYKEQCRQSGKPEKAWDKILDGKLKDFFKMMCLLEQHYVRDTSGKMTVRAFVDSIASQLGTAVVVRRFFRFRTGEE